MLRNDPPPRTRVMFLVAVRTAKAYDVGYLVRPLQKYETDGPADLFEVELNGANIVVRRDQIDTAR